MKTVKTTNRNTVADVERLLRNAASDHAWEPAPPDDLVGRALRRRPRPGRRLTGYSLAGVSLTGVCGVAAAMAAGIAAVFSLHRAPIQAPNLTIATVARKEVSASAKEVSAPAKEVSASAPVVSVTTPRMLTINLIRRPLALRGLRRHRVRTRDHYLARFSAKSLPTPAIASSPLPPPPVWRDQVVERDDSGTILAPVLVAEGTGDDTTIRPALIAIRYQPNEEATQ